ncbi:MAG: hypothetical protein LBF05_03490, partial [Tannerella sp.]|nr:hypothetical protein [Tannerella sp.]
YSAIFRTYFSLFFCGDDVAENVQTYLRATLTGIPSNPVSSPHAVSWHKRVFRGKYHGRILKWKNILTNDRESSATEMIE